MSGEEAWSVILNLCRNNMDEIEFIVDEEAAKSTELLDKVSRIIKEPIAYKQETMFLRKFVIALITASQKEKSKKIPEAIKQFNLQTLLDDENIAAIYCEGVNIPIYVELRNKRKFPTKIMFRNKKEINEIIKDLSQKAAVNVNENNPVIKFSFSNISFQATLGTDFLNPKFVIKKLQREEATK